MLPPKERQTEQIVILPAKKSDSNSIETGLPTKKNRERKKYVLTESETASEYG